MIRTTKLTALAAAISLSLVACGGGGGTGGDTAGIGGSGFISTGTITGFGSVFVNGVKFETDSSSFDIEGVNGTQNDLAIGMVVRVNGTINPDGVTGTATSIIFDDELQGPVANLTIAPDGQTATFTVLGTNVAIDRNSTSFDGTGFSFDSIANLDNVEMSGYLDSTGTLFASRVELEDDVFIPNSSIVEVKGVISSLTDTTFNINTLLINYSSATLEDLPNGLENGILVEVEGTFDGNSTITARSVESEELELSDTDEFELEGYITDYVDSSNFKINGIPVNASGSSVEFSPSTLTLANDLQVEAEGYISNGVLIANEVKLRGGEVKISAEVTSISSDPDNPNSFVVSPINGQTGITISIGAETEMKNEIIESESLDISDLYLGAFVQLEGYEDADFVFASQVKIVDFNDSDGVEVQANIDETVDDGDITVLGVKFDVRSASFEDSNDNSITETAFNTAATSNPLISVTANSDDGIAVKAELE